MRADRGRASLATMLVLLLAGGCAVAPAPAALPAPSRSPRPSPTVPVPTVSPPPPQATLPSEVWAFGGEICGASPHFAGYAGAAPFLGPAPHPIAFALVANGSISWPELPGGWETEDPARVQLLGCITAISRGGVARTCEYEDTGDGSHFNVDVYRATFTIEVRETSTGTLLRTVELTAADTSCPFFVQVDPSDLTINASLTTGQFRQAIGDLVDTYRAPPPRRPPHG